MSRWNGDFQIILAINNGAFRDKRSSKNTVANMLVYKTRLSIRMHHITEVVISAQGGEVRKLTVG